MLDELGHDARLRLMKFVCSFAWADLEVRPEEREFVARLVDRLELEPDECKRVQGWLEVPPDPESIDPTQIPFEHRKLFVEAVEGLVRADGEVAREERDILALFNDLLS